MAMAPLRDDLNLHLRVVLLSILTAYTSYKVNSTVPDPYLDEIFHIPQAQKYCEGKFTDWNPKITTPPGLYILSYLYASAFKILIPVYQWLLANSSFGPDPHGMSSSMASTLMDNKDAEQCTKATECGLENCTGVILRSLNAVGGSILLPWICYEIYLYVHSPYHQIVPPPMQVVEFAQADTSDIRKNRDRGSASPSPSQSSQAQAQKLQAGELISKQMEQEAVAAQVGLNVALFPLLYFFNSLFYTDVWSAIFVLLAYRSFLKYSPWKCAVYSLTSVTFRQTNVLWSVFFLILDVTRLLKRLRPAIQSSESSDLPMDIVMSKASAGVVYDPPVHAASPSDYVKGVISIAIASLHHLGPVLLLAFPYISVIISFIGFVYYNGGITMGDKENHTFTLHPTQILYFFLFTAVSTPWLFIPTSPWKIVATVNTFMKNCFGSPAKAAFSFAVTVLIAGTVHFFTMTHPFMLADNRHYVFYIWRRTVLLHPLAKYAAIPVYFVAGYFVLRALGNKQRPVPPVPTTPQISAFTTTTDTVSFLMAFFAAMAGTLVAAPLVEFRYFVVAWCIWRLHVAPEGSGLKIGGVDSRVLCETVAFLGVHAATTWVFLNKPFRWPNEEGWMRFMW